MGLVGYKRPEYARFAIKKKLLLVFISSSCENRQIRQWAFSKKLKGTFEAAKSSYYFQNFIETEPTNKATPRSSGAAVGRFHRHSAAGWAGCTVAGPGRVRRHAAWFSEGSSAPLIGHARVALSGVLTRLPSTQTDDTRRGGKGHNLLPAP